MVKRLFDDCRLCEDRGVICVGDADDADFPCPHCNGWCSLCLEQPLAGQSGRPLVGSLLAAARRTAAGLELFEGYLCDFHTAAFNWYVMITPAMIGYLKPGDAYIIVQHIFEAHAFTVLYGYGQAKNSRDLEADAFRAVAAQRHARYGWDGFHVCPPDVASRAMLPDWVIWQFGDMRERRSLPSRARLTMWSIAND